MPCAGSPDEARIAVPRRGPGQEGAVAMVVQSSRDSLLAGAFGAFAQTLQPGLSADVRAQRLRFRRVGQLGGRDPRVIRHGSSQLQVLQGFRAGRYLIVRRVRLEIHRELSAPISSWASGRRL